MYHCGGSCCCSARYFALSFTMAVPLWKGRTCLDVCHPGIGGGVVLFVYFVPYTNKNTLKMKPLCNDDLKRNDTLSHNIVLSNSPELPKRLYSKSRRNQMREKSITSLSPLSLPWLNYWNKMLHLEESLETQREREKRGGWERNTFRDMGAI